jgi:tetratricopeptide (TPR) repeat protein
VFWEKYRQKILTITLIVVAIGAGAFWWQRQRQEEEELVAVQLAAARDIPSLQQFTRQSGHQPIGAVAWLRLGDLCFGQGQYAEAAEAYQKLLSLHARSSLAEGAKLGLAASLEAQANYEAAKGAYAQLAGNAGSYAAIPAKLGLARCAEATGQTKEARQLYEEALAAGLNNPWQSPAMLRWTVLNRGQSAKPTATPAVPSTELVVPQPISQ